MPETTILAPGAGEVIGDKPDRTVRILSDHDALHATWSRFGPGRDGADLHIHHEHTDYFYVLAGELTVRLGPGGDPHPVAVGELAAVPPLVAHGFRNSSDAEVRYLNFHAPGMGFADYMRGLRDGTGVGFDQHDVPAEGGLAADLATIGRGEVLIDEDGMRVTRLDEIDAITITETETDGRWTAYGPSAGEQRPIWHWVLDGELELAGARLGAGTWTMTPPGAPGPAPVDGMPSTVLTLA